MLFARQRALRLVQGQVRVVKTPAAEAKCVCRVLYILRFLTLYNRTLVTPPNTTNTIPAVQLQSDVSSLADNEKWLVNGNEDISMKSPVNAIWWQVRNELNVVVNRDSESRSAGSVFCCPNPNPKNLPEFDLKDDFLLADLSSSTGAYPITEIDLEFGVLTTNPCQRKAFPDAKPDARSPHPSFKNGFTTFIIFLRNGPMQKRCAQGLQRGESTKFIYLLGFTD